MFERKTMVAGLVLSVVILCLNTNTLGQKPKRASENFGRLKVVEGYVPTDDGTRLFYQKIGKGKQVVIIPGRLFLFNDFKQLATGRTLIFYDMRNRGRSDAIPDDQKSQKLGIHDDVKDVERIRKYFRVEKFSLVGYSYLGLMTVMYAMEHSARVERVVQIGPVPLKFDTEYPANLQNNDTLAASGANPEEVAKVEKLLADGYDKTSPKDYCEKLWQVTRFRLIGNPAIVEKLGKSRCDMPNEYPVNLAKHFQYNFASVQKLDIPREKVAQVKIPVLIIHGTKDRNAPYGGGREWATIFPNGRLLTIEGAAHQSWIDAPAIIFPAIDLFLNGRSQEAEKISSPLKEKYSVNDRLIIPEGITYDAVENRFYVSSTYLRKIIVIDARTGDSKDFKKTGEDGITGAVGMKVDTKRRILWSISSDAGNGMPIINSKPEHEGKSHVFKYDLNSGNLLKKYTLESGSEQYFLNDLTIDSVGNIYITDSRNGRIYTVDKAGESLIEFYSFENLKPNGIDISYNNKYLFIAFFSGDVGVITLPKKTFRLLKLPPNKQIEADGLYFHKNSLIAISPDNFLIQCALDETFTRVSTIETIYSEKDGKLSQPSTGTIIGNRFYFITNSQLQLFRKLYEEGNYQLNPNLSGPVISSVELK